MGKGTFSEIYEASDLKQERGADGRHPHVALKVAREGQKRSMLQHEEDVLRGLQGCPAVPRFVETGGDASCHYLVMQLLGENLSNMRRLTPDKRLSFRTVVLLGIQICEAIHSMHELGFIHRDIKPSNCCVGLHDEKTCFLLDFGLVRPPVAHARAPSPRARHSSRPRRDTAHVASLMIARAHLHASAPSSAPSNALWARRASPSRASLPSARLAGGGSRTARHARRARLPSSVAPAVTPPSFRIGTRSSGGEMTCGRWSTCYSSCMVRRFRGRRHGTTMRCCSSRSSICMSSSACRATASSFALPGWSCPHAFSTSSSIFTA